MPVRICLRPERFLHQSPSMKNQFVCRQCRNASLATASRVPIPPPPPPNNPIIPSPQAVTRHAPTQPPSHKRPEFRKTQLHRQYQSLLRSTPLMLIFQHNNLRATEWMGIRRELAIAMRRADVESSSSATPTDPSTPAIGAGTKLHTLQTGIFASALKIVELYPSVEIPSTSDRPSGLSRAAWIQAKNHNVLTGLEPLLSGPLAVLAIPSVSPAHLRAALSILAPGKDFPAPKRRAAPGYFEAEVQSGLQKLMLLAARVEGKAFDTDGARWVGTIEGGLDGLRTQLVALLSMAGASVTGTLEAASRSLYVTMEGRKGMLEEEQKEPADAKKE